MVTLAQKVKAEVNMRELLERSGLPLPDVVEYGVTCIRFFYKDQKVVLIVDIE